MFPYKCPLSQCFYFASVLIFISKSGEGPLLVGTLPSAQPMVVFLFEPYQTFDLSAKVLTLSVNALGVFLGRFATGTANRKLP